MVNGKPVDAGVLIWMKPMALLRMKETIGASVFAVTIEPRGGKPTPAYGNASDDWKCEKRLFFSTPHYAVLGSFWLLERNKWLL
jgi:hypothetical protein